MSRCNARLGWNGVQLSQLLFLLHYRTSQTKVVKCTPINIMLCECIVSESFFHICKIFFVFFCFFLWNLLVITLLYCYHLNIYHCLQKKTEVKKWDVNKKSLKQLHVDVVDKLFFRIFFSCQDYQILYGMNKYIFTGNTNSWRSIYDMKFVLDNLLFSFQIYRYLFLL